MRCAALASDRDARIRNPGTVERPGVRGRRRACAGCNDAAPRDMRHSGGAERSVGDGSGPRRRRRQRAFARVGHCLRRKRVGAVGNGRDTRAWKYMPLSARFSGVKLLSRTGHQPFQAFQLGTMIAATLVAAEGCIDDYEYGWCRELFASRANLIDDGVDAGRRVTRSPADASTTVRSRMFVRYCCRNPRQIL